MRACRREDWKCMRCVESSKSSGSRLSWGAAKMGITFIWVRVRVGCKMIWSGLEGQGQTASQCLRKGWLGQWLVGAGHSSRVVVSEIEPGVF